MRINKTMVLATIALVEAVVIALLIWGRFGFQVKRDFINANPLARALEFELPDAEFEAVVKRFPEWIPHQIADPSGVKHGTILSDCAILMRTNYVRILIENGADAEQAVSSLKRVGANNAVELLRQVQSELRDRREAVRGNTNPTTGETTNSSRNVP